ncbi:hypothetical protein [Haliangium sp. UPWRP_2]|uniref:hypothetical protein n=1 Tax=Haliangium sp. UPWRP_2 TaxID=1931276 RepID=UPI00130495C4|nr:hypothetical protein [Haliangium sp. UPWRP_2]
MSHQLAELQDIVGRPITARRLREGASISEQALEEAMAERWNYIRRPPRGAHDAGVLGAARRAAR